MLARAWALPGGAWCLAPRHDVARRVGDVRARRNRALFLNARAAVDAAPAVAAILAEELGKSEAWQAREIESFRTLAAGYMLG